MKLFHDITLHLDDINDFFTASPPDPLSENASYISGVDQIIHELKGTDLDTGVRTTIFLPPEKITPEIESRLKKAIARYCRLHIVRNENEIAALFKTGWKSLYTGGLCILGLLLLSPMLDHLKEAAQAHYFSNFLTDFITIGITLLSWISMWQPLEIFLYRWWPFRRENRIFETMTKMDIIIKSA
jgi:hypothetical protein